MFCFIVEDVDYVILSTVFPNHSELLFDHMVQFVLNPTLRRYLKNVVILANSLLLLWWW